MINPLISLIAGLIFGLGLILSGMYRPDVVISGLKIGADTFSWDLYVTFASALLVTFLLYQLKRFMHKPLTNTCYDLPTKQHIDSSLVIGALLFGIGWGISGICPGPNLVGLALVQYSLYWVNFLGIIMGFFMMRKIMFLR